MRRPAYFCLFLFILAYGLKGQIRIDTFGEFRFGMPRDTVLQVLNDLSISRIDTTNSLALTVADLPIDTLRFDRAFFHFKADRLYMAVLSNYYAVDDEEPALAFYNHLRDGMHQKLGAYSVKPPAYCQWLGKDGNDITLGIQQTKVNEVDILYVSLLFISESTWKKGYIPMEEADTSDQPL